MFFLCCSHSTCSRDASQSQHSNTKRMNVEALLASKPARASRRLISLLLCYCTCYSCLSVAAARLCPLLSAAPSPARKTCCLVVLRPSLATATAIVTAPKRRYRSHPPVSQCEAYLGRPLGVCTSRGALQERQQPPARQPLKAKCCFDLTLPEDTRHRRSRKGANRDLLKRLLEIPRGGWKESKSDNTSGSSTRGSKSWNKEKSTAFDPATHGVSPPHAVAIKAQAAASTELAARIEPAAAKAAAVAGTAVPMEGLFFADIGANLCDPMYQGKYFEKQKHPPDIQE